MTKNFSLQPSHLSLHTSALSPLLLADVPGITVHKQPAGDPHPALDAGSPAVPVYDSNYWLVTITLDENVKIKGQENVRMAA